MAEPRNWDFRRFGFSRYSLADYNSSSSWPREFSTTFNRSSAAACSICSASSVALRLSDYSNLRLRVYSVVLSTSSVLARSTSTRDVHSIEKPSLPPNIAPPPHVRWQIDQPRSFGRENVRALLGGLGLLTPEPIACSRRPVINALSTRKNNEIGEERQSRTEREGERQKNSTHRYCLKSLNEAFSLHVIVTEDLPVSKKPPRHDSRVTPWSPP